MGPEDEPRWTSFREAGGPSAGVAGAAAGIGRMQPSGPLACSSQWVIERARPEVVTDSLRLAYEAHYRPLLRLCVLVTGRRETAEDLVQEAFVRVAGRLGGLGDEEIGPYLRAAALNLWKNRLRRLAVERRRPTQRAPRDELAFEEKDEVWAAVRRLPARQRACLVLRYFEDLTEGETADLLGCSVGTVKSQTSRAIERLRRELGDEA